MHARLIADAAEEAFLYDLSVAPQWREAFNAMLDEEVELPPEGSVLDVGCGTGDYTIGVATSLTDRGTVLGLDPSESRLNLARAKATLKKLDNVSFQVGSVMATGVLPESFDLVVADLGWHSLSEMPSAIKHVREAARHEATVAILCATRGSFDEFHSVYWEALFRESLLEHSPRIEALSLDRPTVSELEAMAKAARLRKVHSVTLTHFFGFDDGATYVASPLIANYFLADWLNVIEDASERSRVLTAIPGVIDDARNGGSFEVSIKATVLVGIR